MFYAALTTQILFFLYYNFSVQSDSARNRIFKLVESVLPILGIIFNINWLILLSIFGYGLMIWEMLLTWLIPVTSITQYFTLRNLILGNTSRYLKTLKQGNVSLKREKLTLQMVLTFVLAVICFVLTLIYYQNYFN